MNSKSYNLTPLLLSAEDAAKVLSVSPAFFYTLHKSGKVPLPLKFGRRSLWSVQELKDWIGAGCPDRPRWKTMKMEKVGQT